MFPSSPNEDTPRADLQLLTHMHTHTCAHTYTDTPAKCESHRGGVCEGRGVGGGRLGESMSSSVASRTFPHFISASPLLSLCPLPPPLPASSSPLPPPPLHLCLSRTLLHGATVFPSVPSFWIYLFSCPLPTQK